MGIEMSFCFSGVSDPAVHALQFLDIIKMKEPREKAHFYTSTLKEALPYIDRVICDANYL